MDVILQHELRKQARARMRPRVARLVRARVCVCARACACVRAFVWVLVFAIVGECVREFRVCRGAANQCESVRNHVDAILQNCMRKNQMRGNEGRVCEHE